MTLATAVTASRLVLSALALICLLVGSNSAYIASLSLLLIAIFTDFLDGYLARKMDQVTTFGTILDALVDKIMVHSLMFGLLSVGVYNPILLFPMFFRDMIVDGLRNKLYAISVFYGANVWGKIKFGLQCLSIVFGILSRMEGFGSEFVQYANAALLFALVMSLPGLWGVGREVLKATDARGSAVISAKQLASQKLISSLGPLI